MGVGATPGSPGGRGGVTGSGGATQKPYAPGENDRLDWRNINDLAKVLRREEGARRPLLVLLYDSKLSKDCCAANFERAVFRDRDVVEEAKKWICVKANKSAVGGLDDLAKFELENDKPAILLLDAESALLDKQQRCVNPPEYLKRIRGAFALNDKRVRMRSKYMAKERKVRALIDGEEYAKAIRSLKGLENKKSQLIGSVLTRVEQDRADLERAGQLAIENANRLREEGSLTAALEIFKKTKKEFQKLDKVRLAASKGEREVRNKLKKMGLGT